MDTYPCFILVVMAVPSFKILYSQDTIPKADVTIKAVGYQWYWGYEYPDENIIFDLGMIEEEDLKDGEPRLLAVDNEIVVPVNKVVKVLITANDVLHAWALPAFGIKRDAMPGRINETWFKVEKTGTFYGQCSELWYQTRFYANRGESCDRGGIFKMVRRCKTKICKRIIFKR